MFKSIKEYKSTGIISKWATHAVVRAVKTMAQTATSFLTVGTVTGIDGMNIMLMSDVNWMMVLSASLLSGILSILFSIGGLPETSAEKDKNDQTPTYPNDQTILK